MFPGFPCRRGCARFVLLACLVAPFTSAEDDPFSVNGFTLEADRLFVDQTIRAFMQKYDIPGLSIAIAKNGELIFAKGYGYADRGRGKKVNVINQFRIASLSKPITAVAIMKLVETGRLSLNERVFGNEGILFTDYPASNAFVEQVTVRHLLEHTAAKEWTNDDHDPMFMEPGRSKHSLVEWVLKSRVLSEPPGTRFAYSNFGYCILGLVIERLSGMSYERFVKDTIFRPIQARSFAIANNKPGGFLLEAKYYPDNESQPHGFPIRRMDAHGGWIANAIDLVLFSLSVDGLPQPADILKPGSIQLMSTPSARNAGYALGWNVNPYNNRWHVGSLPGTAAILVRTEHGYSWAVLLNKRSGRLEFLPDLDALPWTLINGVKVLPGG